MKKSLLKVQCIKANKIVLTDKEFILQGIVVSKFGDQGPEALAWYPDQFSDMELSKISTKSVSIMAREDGILPPAGYLSVLPLPKLHMTAVIYVFEIKQEEARGGIIIHTISILFNENYTSVIYKTIEDIANLITPIDSLVQFIENNEDITKCIKDLFNQVNNLLNNQQKDEITQREIKSDVEKEYENKYSYKIVVIGEPEVGKTSFILRNIDIAFRELFIPVTGVQISLKYIDYDEKTQVKYLFWDITNQELFNKVRRKFYNGSQAVLILYDVTNPKTFKKVKKWYKNIKKICGEIPGFVIGNKIDLQRQIDELEGKKLAEKLGLEYIETSAKTGENINYIFQSLAKMLIENEFKSKLVEKSV